MKSKNVIITADSTCDLPKDIVQKRGIIIIPLSILLGEKSFKDGVDINPSMIYQHFENAGELPKTAAVTPSAYYDIFKKYTDEGFAIVHIGLSSAISSSFQNAVISASEFDDVYVVDSKNLCTAMGLLVLKATDLRDNGLDAKKIADKINKLVPKVESTFVLNSLEYLHKGGRCSGVARFGANILGIKPSIAVDKDGKMDVAKKYRGKMEIVYKQYINDCLSKVNQIDKERIVIANSGGVSADTLAFAEGLIKGKSDFKEIIRSDAGCTISSHCGPQTLAIFYIKK